MEKWNKWWHGRWKKCAYCVYIMKGRFSLIFFKRTSETQLRIDSETAETGILATVIKKLCYFVFYGKSNPTL